MKFQFKGLVAMVCLLGSAGVYAWDAGGGVIIDVVGQDNIATDRPNLQAAIDTAPDGATIHLRGVFQLDGTTVAINRSHLTIAGVAHGRDAALPLLKGLVDGAGLPVFDVIVPGPYFNHFNRGLLIASDTGGVLEDVTVKGIALWGFHRAVMVQNFFASTTRCDDLVVGPETRDIRIENLQVDNTFRAIQAFGGIRDLSVKNNVVTAANHYGILISGEAFACDQPGSPAGTVDAGSLLGVEIKNNDVSMVQGPSTRHPLYVTGPNVDFIVSGNTFDGGSTSAELFGSVENFVLHSNLFMNGGSHGPLGSRLGGVRIGNSGGAVTSGYVLMHNRYENNFADVPPVPRDVRLRIASSGNTVIEGKNTSVLDTGTGNIVTLLGQK